MCKLCRHVCINNVEYPITCVIIFEAIGKFIVRWTSKIYMSNTSVRVIYDLILIIGYYHQHGMYTYTRICCPLINDLCTIIDHHFTIFHQYLEIYKLCNCEYQCFIRQASNTLQKRIWIPHLYDNVIWLSGYLALVENDCFMTLCYKVTVCYNRH